MKFDPTKTVKTRDGREAVIYKVLENKIHGAFVTTGREWVVYSWELDGKCSEGHECKIDLINESVKHEGWINIYSQLKGYGYFNVIFGSKLQADSNADTSARLACIPISFIEGEGL